MRYVDPSDPRGQGVSAAQVAREIEAVYRMESPRLVAGLTRLVRDVGRAEELAQDALVSALEQWPRTGVPDRPAAWLMAAAKNRAIDELRRRAMAERKHAEVGRDLEEIENRTPDLESALDDDVGDDLLRLMFISCHPVLSTEGQVALTLKLLGGLETPEIARAFLVPEATVAQRIVRAKRTLAEAGVPFELPRGADRAARLKAILRVLYLIFNEGYSATAGEHWVRPPLCEEALRLARVLAGLMPEEPEVHGLVALLAIQASRLPARVDARGEPILLLDQDRARWDRVLIGLGLNALERAERRLAARAVTSADDNDARPGPYAVQAAIAACHARARRGEETDWRRIALLYALLAAIAPSPIVELNRAVAVGMAEGPAAGLARVDLLRDEPALAGYHLLPSVRGDLLAKLGRHTEARIEFERAAEMTRNEREQGLLRARAATAAAAAGAASAADVDQS
jgi:RNA polymerase sigma-70 factor (ECF subfamily)